MQSVGLADSVQLAIVADGYPTLKMWGLCLQSEGALTAYAKSLFVTRALDKSVTLENVEFHPCTGP